MSKNTTKYSNNARTTLSAGITTGDTVLNVISSVGFPTISAAGDHFFVTLDNGSNIEVVKVTGVSGNTFTGCVRAQEGTTAFAFASTTKVENRLTAGNITEMARLQDRLRSVNSLEDLIAPANSDGNSALCASVDANSVPIVAVVQGTRWRLLNYPDIINSGTAGGGITTTSMSFPSVGNYLRDLTPKTYVLQFTTGANLGSCRFLTVNSGAGTVTWTTPLPAAPSAADAFEIYRCESAYRMPMGASTDRIFFENDNVIRHDYSIPVGKNAVSAGPVTIASGITVTVPSGSAWSVV